MPFGTIQVTPQHSGVLAGPNPGRTRPSVPELPGYIALLGVPRSWPAIRDMANGAWSRPNRRCSQWLGRLPYHLCSPWAVCARSHLLPDLGQQVGNFPVFEGTSLYVVSHRPQRKQQQPPHACASNVSPSTITGIEVSGQDQPFGQNAYSRTSQQTFRDVAGVGAGHLDPRRQQSE